MIGLPRLDTIQSAAANLVHRARAGSFADLRPMPRIRIDQGQAREVYEYVPQGEAVGDPVLLVLPLGVPSSCFDLRRGCSMVEHLVSQGRPTYLVEYGEIGFAERDLGLDHFVIDALPAAVSAVHERSGGRPVHVVGWCLGGILSVLTAARMGAWPIASLTVIASPFDFTRIPLIVPLRPLITVTGGRALTKLYKTFGTVPA
nr:alpha/beta hydrolase [Actinomycetota bacterium]